MTKDKLIIEEAKKHYSEDIKCYDAFLHGVEFAEKLSPWISVEDDLPCNHEELIAPVVYEDKIETLLVLANLGGYMFITKMKKSNGEWWIPTPPIKVEKQTEVHGEVEKIKGNVQPRKLVHTAWIRYDANWVSENNAKCGVEDTGYTEDEIAEAIFDWWISGKPYKQWYADKYLHLKFDFGDEENETAH